MCSAKYIPNRVDIEWLKRGGGIGPAEREPQPAIAPAE
jgi:hypothetical protein